MGISISSDCANGAITDSAFIAIEGFVTGANTMRMNPDTHMMESTAVNANKAKIYLYYRQTRPDSTATPPEPGTTAYLLDSNLAVFETSQTGDASYHERVQANMPAQNATVVTAGCWSVRCEALLDIAGPPPTSSMVASVEKTVNLVYNARP